MPFDPTKPAGSTPLSSTEIRAQLNALKALIDLMQTTLNAVNNAAANLQNQLTALTADTPHNCTAVSDLSVSSHIAVGGAALDTHNCTAVSDLSVSLSNPPQPGEVQVIIDKINELLGVLRR